MRARQEKETEPASTRIRRTVVVTDVVVTRQLSSLAHAGAIVRSQVRPQSSPGAGASSAMARAITGVG